MCHAELDSASIKVDLWKMNINDLMIYMKTGYVYILSNLSRTTLYIGVTSNLDARVKQHKNGTGCVFSSKYKIFDLLHFEQFQTMEQAIRREKQLKRWHRKWKWDLIKENNPDLLDLMTLDENSYLNRSS